MWYYSTKSHLDELLDTLDGAEWEKDLFSALQEMRDDIVKQMSITEELTNTNKGSKKSTMENEIGKSCCTT